MLFISHVFNLLNALKDLSASHELAGDTISNINKFELLEKKYNFIRHSFNFVYTIHVVITFL